MDSATYDRLVKLRDRRAKEAAVKAAEEPDLDARGDPIPLGDVLVFIPPADFRALLDEARPADADDRNGLRIFDGLRKGLKGAKGRTEPAITIQHLNFLLERVEKPAPAPAPAPEPAPRARSK